MPISDCDSHASIIIYSHGLYPFNRCLGIYLISSVLMSFGRTGTIVTLHYIEVYSRNAYSIIQLISLAFRNYGIYAGIHAITHINHVIADDCSHFF